MTELGFIVLLIIGLIIFGSSSSNNDSEELEVGRNIDGSFYVYGKESGKIYFEGSESDCKKYITG